MNILPPSSGSKRILKKQAASKVGFYSASYLVVVHSAYSSTLKMEAVRFSESSVYFYQTTRRYPRRLVLVIVFVVRPSDLAYFTFDPRHALE
jgi:hypothetical protein